MNDSHLMGGVARQDISPAKGIFLGGYNNCNRGNTGIHDKLTATSLVLDDGEKKIAIIACDLLIINEVISDQIRLELEPEIIPVICCSQTHSGPVGFADYRSSPNQRRYIENLIKKIVAVTFEAANHLEPVQLTWSQGEFTPEDQLIGGLPTSGKRPVHILNIVKTNGSRTATLVNLAHPGKVLGVESLSVSADWIGAMRTRVENDLGGLCLFLQGAAGNLVIQKNKERVDPWKKVQSQGNHIAEVVLKACREGSEPVNHIPIQLIREEIPLSFDTPVTTTTPPSNDTNLLKMMRMPAFLSFFARFLLNWRLPWKVHLEEMEGYWSIPMRINAIRIGDIAILTLAADVFNEIEIEVRENSPAPHMMFVTATDGNIGILPTQKAIEEDSLIQNLLPLSYHLPGKLTANCEEESLESAYQVLDELWYVENLLNDHDG